MFSALHIPVWRDLLRDYPDCLICDFLEYGWPISYTSATLPTFDLRTHVILTLDYSLRGKISLHLSKSPYRSLQLS